MWSTAPATPPERVQCMGCGREVDVRDLGWKDWFRCASCDRVHLLRKRLAEFRYDLRYARIERVKALIFVLLAFVFSWLGGWIIVDLIGRPWMVYGIEFGSAVLICAVAGYMNRRTQDILLIAGVVTALLAARRIGLLEMVRSYGAEPYAPFPWVMVGTAVVCFALVAYQRRFIDPR